MKKSKNNSTKVTEFMEKLDHPLKAEIEIMRNIIKGINLAITEQIKWNAPSYSYKEYLVTFNLHRTEHIHLVFHNPQIVQIKSDILEGDYTDRRMAYFCDLNDVLGKKEAVENVLKELIRLIDLKEEIGVGLG